MMLSDLSKIKNLYTTALLVATLALTSLGCGAVQVKHPGLIFDQQDVLAMRQAIAATGSAQSSFGQAFQSNQSLVDQQLDVPIDVPIPKDAGGGYTHEQHKRNYQLIYNAGVMYQLTQEQKYADHATAILLQYAKMYPGLPLHPRQKEQSAGKLFWQSLNEAVWLVYSIVGYDAIADALSAEQRETIEQGIFRPMALFLSEGSPQTFNKVHNHGTWATAAVGMTGYVVGELDWVEKSLYGLDKSGTGGFMKQLEMLFSPQGYYNEGPYYQRYALMPFVLFAKSIEINQPQRKIFEFRDSILLKAIDSTIQLSYNKLFFPINDAIKDKGIDTIELVFGVSIAYGLTGDNTLLSIAQQQQQILLTGDGLRVANGIDNNLQQAYEFRSKVFGDGPKGEEGALVVMRSNQSSDHQALVLKATAQGLGHGHFDKLSWLFYDNGNEIINDYGAARFLNVEAKYGGHYLPENKTYAHQTIAHSTLVVDETSHFNGNTASGNKHHPKLHFFAQGEQVQIASASMSDAYDDVSFSRTQALVSYPGLSRPFVIDILDVNSNNDHQYDLPVQYSGQLMDTNLTLNAFTESLAPLGKKNGYQHLWLTAQAQANTNTQAALAKITWLNNGRFYTHSTVASNDLKVLFTKTGANDPDVNLRTENAFVLRIPSAARHQFVSILELHGEYNPSKEFTLDSHSKISRLSHQQEGSIHSVAVSFNDGVDLLVAFNSSTTLTENTPSQLAFAGKTYSFSGRAKVFDLSDQRSK